MRKTAEELAELLKDEDLTREEIPMEDVQRHSYLFKHVPKWNLVQAKDKKHEYFYSGDVKVTVGFYRFGVRFRSGKLLRGVARGKAVLAEDEVKFLIGQKDALLALLCHDIDRSLLTRRAPRTAFEDGTLPVYPEELPDFIETQEIRPFPTPENLRENFYLVMWIGFMEIPLPQSEDTILSVTCNLAPKARY